MSESIKPVRYGILIGLLGLVFGIGWAVWLVVGHDRIHQSLEQKMGPAKSEAGFLELLAPGLAHSHPDEEAPSEEPEESHSHEHGAGGATSHFEGGHEDPIMELAHTRLRWAHVHYMGLGLLTIALSLVLAFTGASERIKGVSSILTGLGGLIYPSAWIVMGYRTPSLGPDASLVSVTAIAVPGIVLVLFGLLMTTFFLLKAIFPKNG